MSLEAELVSPGSSVWYAQWVSSEDEAPDSFRWLCLVLMSPILSSLPIVMPLSASQEHEEISPSTWDPSGQSTLSPLFIQPNSQKKPPVVTPLTPHPLMEHLRSGSVPTIQLKALLSVANGLWLPHPQGFLSPSLPSPQSSTVTQWLLLWLFSSHFQDFGASWVFSFHV